MFFNLDRNSKQNLLNQYKQDAMDYRQKKNNEKQRRIQEEREYLAKRELLEKEADERIYREKLQRKNAQREEYNTMLMKTKNNIPGYRHNFNKNKDIVLNNWGGQEKSHQIQIQATPQSPPPEQNKGNNNFIVVPQGDGTPWKGKKSYKNEDHLTNFLNDDRNDQELNKYIKSEKEYKQKMYKDLLYSQFQEASNKNMNLYGTNDPLIVERKRKRYLSQDPFAKNNNYDFSKSNLIHNPIVDPQNNLEYNKYLKFSESQRSMSIRGNYQMNNLNNNNNNQNTQYQNNNMQYQNNNMQYQNNNMPNINNISIYKNYNVSNNNNNFNRMEEFKSNNYETSNINRGIKLNNNYNQNLAVENNNNINNNSFGIEEHQKGPNQNIGYNNNSFRPTPSGERIRQAAASNFF